MLFLFYVLALLKIQVLEIIWKSEIVGYFVFQSHGRQFINISHDFCKPLHRKYVFIFSFKKKNFIQKVLPPMNFLLGIFIDCPTSLIPPLH